MEVIIVTVIVFLSILFYGIIDSFIKNKRKKIAIKKYVLRDRIWSTLFLDKAEKLRTKENQLTKGGIK